VINVRITSATNVPAPIVNAMVVTTATADVTVPVEAVTTATADVTVPVEAVTTATATVVTVDTVNPKSKLTYKTPWELKPPGGFYLFGKLRIKT